MRCIATSGFVLWPLMLLAQIRMNALRMVISIAQLGPSQMRHMIKYVHGSVCQMSYNCMTASSAILQGLEHGSEQFTELALVIIMHFCRRHFRTAFPYFVLRSSTRCFAWRSSKKRSPSKLTCASPHYCYKSSPTPAVRLLAVSMWASETSNSLSYVGYAMK